MQAGLRQGLELVLVPVLVPEPVLAGHKPPEEVVLQGLRVNRCFPILLITFFFSFSHNLPLKSLSPEN